MHKICFTISFISCLYMFRAHVLIIKRLKLHYTASGIITPIDKYTEMHDQQNVKICFTCLTKQLIRGSVRPSYTYWLKFQRCGSSRRKAGRPVRDYYTHMIHRSIKEHLYIDTKNEFQNVGLTVHSSPK